MKTNLLAKWLSLLLALIILLALPACSSIKSIQTNPSANADDGTVKTRIITDALGREVEIPLKIERIVPLGNAVRYLTYLGLSDKFVGMQQPEMSPTQIMAFAYVHKEEWSKLPLVGNDAGGAAEFYAEELIACKPDIIVTTYPADIADEVQNQTGIPVVVASAMRVGSNLFSKEYNDDLLFLGDVCGVSERAEELVAYIEDNLTDVQNRVKNAVSSDKPTVLAAGATFSGIHSIDGVYTHYPVFELLAVDDVAKNVAEKSGGVLVDKEQILSWNPDMIFFDASSLSMVNTDYTENPDYFESLKAVQNGALYQWPNSTAHSTNVEIPLATLYYVGSVLYPNAFSDIDFEEKASEIFDMFLGEPDYLHVLNDAGYGYGQVTLEK